jgi:hypothetical protein
MSIYGVFHSPWVTHNAKTPLLQANRARKSVLCGLIHQQQEALALPVTGGVVSVTDIPNELAELK